MMREDDFLINLVIFILFLCNILILTNWTVSYNILHNSWTCTEEVQVGDDITHHECITYKRNQVK